MAEIRVRSDEVVEKWHRILSDVELHGHDVVVYRNGTPAAVVVPYSDYEALRWVREQLESKRRKKSDFLSAFTNHYDDEWDDDDTDVSDAFELRPRSRR